MEASLFVGIDIGGSGVRAAVSSSRGDVLASGAGATLDEALRGVVARVGDTPCSVFAGTRGLSVPGRPEALIAQLGALFAGAKVHVSSDAEIALCGALAGGEGVVVAAGTGSIALARRVDGREARAGGWGYLLGDDGSGYWIGREALRDYLRDRATGSRFFSDLGRSVTDVLGWVYAPGDQVERIASLAPLVSEAASAGDDDARAILDRAGQALAELALAAAREIGLAAPNVACTGGVWQSRFVSAAFDAALAGATRIPPRLPPVVGAVLLAMGGTAPEEVVGRLAAGPTTTSASQSGLSAS